MYRCQWRKWPFLSVSNLLPRINQNRGDDGTYNKVNIRRLHRVNTLEIIKSIQGAADAGGNGGKTDKTFDGGDVIGLFFGS